MISFEAFMNSSPLNKALHYRWLIFWILAFGYVLVYFHRLCPAVVAVDMMRDLHTGGAMLGLLGSAYFYPYALMQLPAGLLSDSWGSRKTISLFWDMCLSRTVGWTELLPWSGINRPSLFFFCAELWRSWPAFFSKKLWSRNKQIVN